MTRLRSAPARQEIDRNIFGLFLEAKRIARGLGRAALAKEARVPLDTVRRVADRRPIPRAAFLKLCRWQSEAPSLFEIRRPEVAARG